LCTLDTGILYRYNLQCVVDQPLLIYEKDAKGSGCQMTGFECNGAASAQEQRMRAVAQL
ncbi:hypothetical protein PF001_g33507, partial [Phytophthora fragariae]